MFIFYISIPHCQVRFLAISRHILKMLLVIKPLRSVRSQSQLIPSSSRLFSSGTGLTEKDWRSMFLKVRHCIQQACNTSNRRPRDPVKHRDVSADRHITCSTDKALHLATRSPALSSTPPPPKLQLYKTLAHPDLVSPSSDSSSSSSSLCRTFLIFISTTIINIFFLSSSYYYYSLCPRFLPLLFLLTPLSSVSSPPLSSQVFNLHNRVLILLFVLLITFQSSPPSTILSPSALASYCFSQ